MYMYIYVYIRRKQEKIGVEINPMETGKKRSMKLKVRSLFDF